MVGQHLDDRAHRGPHRGGGAGRRAAARGLRPSERDEPPGTSPARDRAARAADRGGDSGVRGDGRPRLRRRCRGGAHRGLRGPRHRGPVQRGRPRARHRCRTGTVPRRGGTVLGRGGRSRTGLRGRARRGATGGDDAPPHHLPGAGRRCRPDGGGRAHPLRADRPAPAVPVVLPGTDRGGGDRRRRLRARRLRGRGQHHVRHLRDRVQPAARADQRPAPAADGRAAPRPTRAPWPKPALTPLR